MLLGTTAIALVADISSSHADTVIWSGTQSSNWADDNNWSRIGGANSAPTSSDDVFFNTTAPSAVLSSGSGYSRGVVVGQANYTGAFTISSGAALNSSGSAFIGYDQQANGTVTVTGTNSTWNITNSALYVGYYGTGTLNLAAGGAVGASQVSIGNYASGAGAVTIDGTGSLLLAFN